MNVFLTDQEEAGDMQLCYWKPGMQKHANVPGKKIGDANFAPWINEEIRRAPAGMIFFFTTVTTDIF